MNFLSLLFSFSLIIALIDSIFGQLNQSYDYYFLELTWPKTFCAHNNCPRRPADHFVIHGNWPNRFNGRMLNFCQNDDQEEDFTLLRPIESELIEYWPGLKGNDHAGFWQYEYRKHGTCATETPELRGIKNYFTTTLNMVRNLNIDNVLINLDLNPNQNLRPYSTGGFIESLSDHYGALPSLKCWRDRRTGQSFLSNISFCFDKQLNLINCPKRSQCGNDLLFPN